jgi:hypothetical protein
MLPAIEEQNMKTKSQENIWSYGGWIGKITCLGPRLTHSVCVSVLTLHNAFMFIQNVKKGLEVLGYYNTHLNEQNFPVNTCRNQCLLRYGPCPCDLYSKCSVWFPCSSTQLAALRHTEVRSLSKIPGFTQISWQTFSTRCCNTSKSLIGAENTKAFTYPHSQKSIRSRSGDHAGQLTGPPRPIHVSPKVWFRCCLTIGRKWGGAPSCMNFMCCRWWRGTCSEGTGKSFTKYDGTLHLLVC